MTDHALYRFFDADGVLLYVGITNNPGRRWSQHEKAKPWWHEVQHVEMERHDSRAAALGAESAAIRAEHPRYNIAGAPKPEAPVDPAYTLNCKVCGNLATAVYLRIDEHVKYVKWREKMRSRASSWEPIDLLGDIPWPAPWRICCDDCYPGDDQVYYWFHVKHSRRAAVDVIRHLSEKGWVGEETDWGNLAVRLLAPAEAALPRGQAW